MTQRLSGQIRDEIHTKVINAVYGERKTALSLREDELARRIIKHAIGAEHWATYQAVPDFWLGATRDINVVLAGSYTRLQLVKHVKVPREWANGVAIATIDRGNGLVEAWEVLRAEWQTLNKELDKFKVDTKAVLDRAGTVKSLVEMWPEVLPYVSAKALAKKTPLPVPVGLLAGINAKLPPQSKAA